jgi:hypothetical protein
MTSAHFPFSNVQLELLKLFASDIPDTELEVLRKILIRFKAERIMDMADKLWDEKNWSDEEIIQFLEEPKRTPYKKENE